MALTFKLKKPPGKATLSKKVTSGPTVVLDVQEDEMVVMPSAAGADPQGVYPNVLTPWAEVGFAAGFTKNMGDYNSARVEITLKVTCETTEIDGAYEFAEDWVSTRLKKQHEELGE